MTETTTTEATQVQPGENTDVETATEAQTQTEAHAPIEATDGDGREEDVRAGSEAAKYRRRLRETEAERDTALAATEQAQRALVETLAGKNNVKPAALWAAGTQLADLLTDGQVDPDRVREACKTARTTLGLSPFYPPGTLKPDMSQGMGGAPMRGAGGFSSAFEPS